MVESVTLRFRYEVAHYGRCLRFILHINAIYFSTSSSASLSFSYPPPTWLFVRLFHHAVTSSGYVGSDKRKGHGRNVVFRCYLECSHLGSLMELHTHILRHWLHPLLHVPYSKHVGNSAFHENEKQTRLESF